jgi:aspartyl-tRNA(Asn)/glutamyl-tRNA(Gln) amidotransferase subunit C
MAEVNESLTLKVADLARLELTEQETVTFTQQLKSILGYVEKLSEVQVKGIEPMTHPLDVETPMREDVLKPFPLDEHGRPRVLKNAPEVLHDGFKVPPII